MRHFKRGLLSALLIVVMLGLSSVFDFTSVVTAQSIPTSPPFGATFGSMSDDARYIAFTSDADNLVPNDTNGTQDVFVYDRQTVQLTRISVDSNGNQADGGSDFPTISADGRYVAFFSGATNLVANDTNGMGDTFVHDRQTGQTIRVSVDSNGNQGNGSSFYSMISGNGQVVMFDSYATNLVTGDTNDMLDVFAHNIQTGQTTRVSVDSSGNQATWFNPFYGSYGTWISYDGRYIAFSSYANNLVANDTNFVDDVFVHDRQTAQTTRISVDSGGVESNGYSPVAFISDDGRYAAFVSSATNLVPDDLNGVDDVFIRDRQTNQTTRISVSSDGAEGDANSSGYGFISPDGRYVLFQSEASTLTPTDTSGATVGYIRDRQTNTTTRISINVPNPELALISIYDVSPDMRYILFTALGNLVATDTNNLFDVYLLDRQTASLSRVSGAITAPAMPTLIAPVNGVPVPTTTVNFSWNPVNMASSYQIQISTNVGFTAIVQDHIVTTNSHTQVLTTPPTTFYWRVRAINSAGNSGWSAVRSFTVTPPLPDTPVLIAPANGEDMSSSPVNLSWGASANAASYQIQIAIDNGFTQMLDDEITANTSYLFTFPYYTRAFWRVRATNITGNSVWSEVRRVNYPAPPFAEGSTTRTISSYISWIFPATSTADSETFFAVNKVNDGQFNSYVLKLVEYSLTDGIIREIPLVVNPLQYGAISNIYNILDVSGDGRYLLLAFSSYTTNALHLHPFWYDNQTHTVVQVAGGLSEGIAISDNGRFVFYSIPTDINLSAYVYDAQTGLSNLIESNPYYHQYTGGFSSDSRYIYFSDDSRTGIIKSYDIQTGQVTSLLTADDTPMPMWYKLNVSGDGRYLVFDSEATNLVPNDTNNATDVFVYDLSTRAVSLVSVDSNGVQGNYRSLAQSLSHDGRFISFISYATNLVPNDTNGFIDTFVHDRQTGNTSRVSVDSNGFEGNGHSGYETNYNAYPGTAFMMNNARFVIFPTSATNFNATGLDIYGGLFFHVRVPSIIPQAPTVIGPFEGQIIGGVEAIFAWEEIVDATRYDIQIASDANFNTILNSATVLFATHEFTLPAIDTYYWRVRGVNSNGNGAWSATTQFAVGETNDFAVDEQQLFTAMQSQMTEPLQFVLFDITPTGIITTLQFTDGAVVTTTVQMTLQNGLITISLNAMSGGSTTQQAWVMQQLPTLLMGMLDDVLPDNYSSMQTMTLTGNSIGFEVISEVD